MTAGALGEERPTLFLRNATGLVRGWSVRDSMIYATLSTNVVTLGMVEWTVQSSFPHGNLLYSILLSGVWVSFLVVAYTGLVTRSRGPAATTSGRAASWAAGSAS